MPEQLEIVVVEPVPHLDRNAPPPAPREVDRFTVPLDNPRGLHPRRVAAAKLAMEGWCRDHGGRVRSLTPRREADGADLHFYAVVEDARAVPRGKPVTRAGVHAAAAPNRLVKRP
jgi:hypothetical protein